MLVRCAEVSEEVALAAIVGPSAKPTWGGVSSG